MGIRSPELSELQHILSFLPFCTICCHMATPWDPTVISPSPTVTSPSMLIRNSVHLYTEQGTMIMKRPLVVVVVIAGVLLLICYSVARNTMSWTRKSSRCRVPHDATQSVEAPTNPNWKKFTFRAHAPTYTAGNKSCQQTCQCLQNCVPCSCGWEEQCCSDVLSREPYILSHVKHKRIVVASVDTKNYFYTWYAPITALLWQNAMNWKFVLLVVYERDEELTPVLKSILQFTEAAGAEIVYLKNHLKEPHYLAENGGHAE